jgi:hypothetical protein
MPPESQTLARQGPDHGVESRAIPLGDQRRICEPGVCAGAFAVT